MHSSLFAPSTYDWTGNAAPFIFGLDQHRETGWIPFAITRGLPTPVGIPDLFSDVMGLFTDTDRPSP